MDANATDEPKTGRRVLIVYRHPLLRDIVRRVLEAQPQTTVVASLTPEELTAARLVELNPSEVVVDQDVVDGVHDRAVDLAWRVLTYERPRRLIVVGLHSSCVRILTRHDWINPDEAELAVALQAA